MQQEIEDLKKRILVLEKNLGGVGLGEDNFSDRKVFRKKVELFDGNNIITSTDTGSSFGDSTSQKVSVYGVTPVIQQNAIASPTSPGGVYSQAEMVSLYNAIISLRNAIKNFGITA